MLVYNLKDRSSLEVLPLKDFFIPICVRHHFSLPAQRRERIWSFNCVNATAVFMLSNIFARRRLKTWLNLIWCTWSSWSVTRVKSHTLRWDGLMVRSAWPFDHQTGHRLIFADPEMNRVDQLTGERDQPKQADIAWIKELTGELVQWYRQFWAGGHPVSSGAGTNLTVEDTAITHVRPEFFWSCPPLCGSVKYN